MVKGTEFLSNNKQVLSSVPQSDRASGIVDLKYRGLSTQKALGVYGNTNTVRFEVKISIQEKACTRRRFLSMVGQTYQPSGLLQSFILPAKKILLKVCQMVLPRDELFLVMESLGKLWVQWL